MRGFRVILDEIVRIASAIVAVTAVLSLLFSIASFFASRGPLAAEVDVFSLRGVRLAAQVGQSFRGRLLDATRGLDARTRATVIGEWSRVESLLRADTSVLVLQISNRGSRPLSNLGITLDFVSQFRDIAIDTNARTVIEVLANAPLATYLPAAQRLEIQTFPRLPAKTKVTVTIWGTFDLSPDLSTTIVTDELGTIQPALAARVTGFRAKVLENAHWLTVALGLFVMYEVVTALDNARRKRLNGNSQ